MRWVSPCGTPTQFAPKNFPAHCLSRTRPKHGRKFARAYTLYSPTCSRPLSHAHTTFNNTNRERERSNLRCNLYPLPFALLVLHWRSILPLCISLFPQTLEITEKKRSLSLSPIYPRQSSTFCLSLCLITIPCLLIILHRSLSPPCSP